MTTVPTYTITTVVTPFSGSNDLTSLLNVRTDLKLDGSKPNDDIYLRRQIRQVSQTIRNFCNREFALQTYQDFVRPTRDYRPWFLPAKYPRYTVQNVPLNSVTSVKENTTLLTVGVDYEINLAENAIYRLDDFGNPTDWQTWPLTVVYVAGFTLPPVDDPTLPADIEDAVMRLMRLKWFDRNRDPGLKSQEIAQVGREEYWIATGVDGGAMTPDVIDILNNYRRNVVA